MRKECDTCFYYKRDLYEEPCISCRDEVPTHWRGTTNADRIRSMTDEELAEWVWGIETAARAYGPRGKKAWLRWLQEEAGE